MAKLKTGRSFNPPTILLSFLSFGLCFIRSGLGLNSDSRTNNLPRCTDVDRRRKRKRTTNKGIRRTRNESKKQSVKDAVSDEIVSLCIHRVYIGYTSGIAITTHNIYIFKGASHIGVCVYTVTPTYIHPSGYTHFHRTIYKSNSLYIRL